MDNKINKELLELLDDIVNDLIYYDLEYNSNLDKLTREGLIALMNYRSDQSMSRDCRVKRCAKLISVLEELQNGT